MIHAAAFFTLTLATLFLMSISPVAAETTVNVNSNTGGNTVCQNGKCTTTEGTSKSKVCVNDQCWDSENENVDYESPDGNTKVKITNNSDAKVEQESEQNTNTTVTVTDGAKKIEPTIKQEVKAAKDEAKKKIEEMTKEFDIMEFINAQLEEIKGLFTLDFLFGKK